ncbi:3-phosphoserine/phosphohydroxythreonine transaminase [Pedobacter sp. UC225_61]|uniref:3-phosphoserine/phosphohydroxythreonine transaminase n=1 Tax=Pedobacter sp. UC225_61 TaxID=3374623 RepID=UPI00379101E7
MSVQHKHNFGAGPCILPGAVLEKAASAVLDWNGMGLSILEVSHRSAEFEEVTIRVEALVRELLGVPGDYAVLFLQGGASSQFSMVPQNFMPASGNRTPVYLDSGYFALKAMAEASIYGKINIAASSMDRKYTYIPKNYKVNSDAAYFHMTSNNTIEGTQVFDIPKTGVPLICDMSSDIFSRRINVCDFDLIYAGAQKNLGPAGMTLVIAKKALINLVDKLLPSMADYRVHERNGSLYNTPPVFSIYVAMLNLQWLKEQGGIQAIEKLSIEKADMLYEAIDKSSIFYGLAEKGDRSRMNVTFKCYDPLLEEKFLNYASERGIVGIKGFWSVGGFRASMYNGLPLFSVAHLVKVMSHFEKLQELKAINASQKSMV